MSDVEIESFEITDYDLDNEFNINRPRRKLSKNQQIYGVWADDSGDEAEIQVKNFKGGRGSNKHNYSAPVSFISGGVHQAGKEKGKEGKKEKDDEEEEEENEEQSPRAGFGTRRRQTDIPNSSSEDEDVPIPQSSKFRQQFHKGLDIDGDIAGLRKKKPSGYPSSLGNRGVGNWEKHTKGIGAKLLLQMGFQPGKGLGKDLQGISAPVEAHLRKGRGAIGAYGPEKVQKIAEVRIEASDEEDADSMKKLSQWRKGESYNKKKKVKYVYKSVDEVLEQGNTKSVRKDYSQLSKVKVIDMTGPQQRVLSGYHAIAGQQRPSDEWEFRKDKKFSNFALPELQHNLNLLMDMCEQDIIENNRRVNHASDRTVALEAEEAMLSKVLHQEAQHLNTLESALAILQDLVEPGSNLSLDKAASSFKELQDKYYEEYCMFEIGNVAASIIGPLLKERLASWQPLCNPEEPVTMFKQWYDILECERSRSGASQNPYHKLVWDAWMPSVRAAVQGWSCRDCTPMIELLECWIPLLPGWILDNIREQLVLPRIQSEVDDWNPVTDTVPIHAWIHPWLPLLGTRLESTVYPVIRHKLSKALVNWHPSDSSACLMLKPWHQVFARGDLDAFLVKNILPKLQLAMQELIINPHMQDLDRWNWVMEWLDLLPLPSMISLLDNFFFPKWLQILSLWLNHGPNYDEVTNWYTGWKSLVPPRLHIQPTIKEHFRKALDLMNRSVGQPIEAAAYLEPPHHPLPQRPEMMVETVRTASQIPQGFKELIQKRCEERGIVFVPLLNRYREGRQIYRCGKVQIYIDRNVVFVSETSTIWNPTSLAALLEMSS